MWEKGVPDIGTSLHSSRTGVNAAQTGVNEGQSADGVRKPVGYERTWDLVGHSGLGFYSEHYGYIYIYICIYVWLH